MLQHETQSAAVCFINEMLISFQYKKKTSHKPLPFCPNGKTGEFSAAKELGVKVLEPTMPEMVTSSGKVWSDLWLCNL